MSQEGHHRVRWEIDVFNADSPLEAARSALEIMQDPESTATYFIVFDRIAGKAYSVDLMGEEGDIAVTELSEDSTS